MMQALRSGGGGEGGLTPPPNALAFFECEAVIESAPSTMAIDLSTILPLMTASRTYAYSLILWRDDVVSSPGFTYVDNIIYLGGRINSGGGLDINVKTDLRTNSGSMTSGVQLNAGNPVSSKSVSSGVLTITLGTTTETERVGKWRGLFLVLPPYTDEYTGQKITACPSGFLTFT